MLIKYLRLLYPHFYGQLAIYQDDNLYNNSFLLLIIFWITSYSYQH